MQDIETLKQQAQDQINGANSLSKLESIRVDYFGKKGHITSLYKELGKLKADEKPQAGQLINQAKNHIAELLDAKLLDLKEEELKKKLDSEIIDVTLPGKNSYQGSIHPITQIKQEIIQYFFGLGFDIVSGPEVETEFYNFTALNIPPLHPARAMHDTFYFGDGKLLRTHTSPVQIHLMEKTKPPLRLIAPGRVYRHDSDLTHTPMFHQVEGLLIDKNANLAELKWLLNDFLNFIFKKDLTIQFRPSYFPFTEPSAEIDVSCMKCNGSGCRLCKYTGWLEVGGCGMVHPNVLNIVNISSEEYQGWAFGMGIDRLALLYFGLDDLRALFENDLNLLQQF